MSNVQDVFNHGKAFIPFVTAGDFGLDLTESLLFAIQENGADLIEIGIPFSDPTAEGPVIQDASERALKLGTTPSKIIEMVKHARTNGLTIPLAFMTYANPVFNFGIENFAKECVACDVCAVIIPEVPFEEKHEMSDIFESYGISMISLIAPTSHDRIKMIVSEATGFIYCVSSMGVTGMRNKITTNVGEMVNLVKQTKDIPCAIGFGVSTPEQAKEMAQYADGVIIGSAIVNIVAQHGKDSIPYVSDFVKAVKMAITD
ncbi:MAG: tryptophan synthase subunit alpha [Methanosphaera sp.]|nr:tryptophan synthase subunit alpha [Methanosphaera sp.]MCD7800576.1 tryptophan synthase subunit alpha [Ruminococcus sp.]